jgi:group I intron endonuclease
MRRWIYTIKNTHNGKVYVGQSKMPEVRWMRHKQLAEKGKVHPLYCAIRAHNVSSFRFEILETSDDASSDIRERFWIKSLRTCDRRFGYNLEAGGNSRKTLPLSTRQKMSRARLGRISPMLGRKQSAEARLKISIANRGKSRHVQTKSTRLKLSKIFSGPNHRNYGKKLELPTRLRIAASLFQPVEKLDASGAVIAWFPSAKNAAELTGVSRSFISTKCKQGIFWRKAQRGGTN